MKKQEESLDATSMLTSSTTSHLSENVTCHPKRVKIVTDFGIGQTTSDEMNANIANSIETETKDKAPVSQNEVTLVKEVAHTPHWFFISSKLSSSNQFEFGMLHSQLSQPKPTVGKSASLVSTSVATKLNLTHSVNSYSGAFFDNMKPPESLLVPKKFTFGNSLSIKLLIPSKKVPMPSDNPLGAFSAGAGAMHPTTSTTK
jgi:hypothetical protein